MKEIGEKLKEAREAKGMSLEDISEQTKIRILYLRALEKGQFDKLPFKVYVKGFLKAYAKAVDIDSEGLLNWYQEYLNQNDIEEDTKLSEIPIMKSRSSKSFKKILIFIVILGILVAGFFFVKNLWEVIQNEAIPQLIEPNENNQSIGDNSTTIEDDHTVADNKSGTGESDENNNLLDNNLLDNNLLDNNPLDQTSSVEEQINNSENLPNNEPTIDNDTNSTDKPAQDPDVATNSDDVKTASGELDVQEDNDEKDAVEKNEAKKDEAKKDDAKKDDVKTAETEITVNESNLNSNKNLVNAVDSNQFEQVKNVDAENVETETTKTKSDDVEQAPIPTSENASNQNSIESQSIEEQKSTEIMVIVNDTSWVRISNGKEVLFQGVMKAGDKKLFQGEKIQMRINNAAAIQVSFNGLILGPFGAKDQFVEKVFGE